MLQLASESVNGKVCDKKKISSLQLVSGLQKYPRLRSLHFVDSAIPPGKG